MKTEMKVFALRDAGAVKRSHTRFTIGEYNIAIHSWNMLNLLFLLYPATPSENMIKAICWHDVPERWTGDIPATAKWASPALKATLDELERRVFKELDMFEIFESLTKVESRWLKALDKLELLLWATEQATRGNEQAAAMADRILDFMDKPENEIPEEIRHFVDNAAPVEIPELDKL